MRAGFGPDRRATGAGGADLQRGLAGRDVEQHHRLVEILGEAANPRHRVDLGKARVRQGVMLGPGHAGIQQRRLGPLDQAVVFGVDADQGAVGAGQFHDAKDVGVG